jgi:ferredoxin
VGLLTIVVQANNVHCTFLGLLPCLLACTSCVAACPTSVLLLLLLQVMHKYRPLMPGKATGFLIK